MRQLHENPADLVPTPPADLDSGLERAAALVDDPAAHDDTSATGPPLSLEVLVTAVLTAAPPRPLCESMHAA